MKFKEKLIEELMKTHLEDSKTRINPDAVKLLAEVIRLVVTEGATRAAHQALQEGDDTVSLNHMEKILAQLLLDI